MLGELSADEGIKLKALAKQHPEIQSEIEEVELALINFAAKTPPENLKQTILSKIDIQEAKVIQLNTKSNSSLKWLATACLALLFGSTIYNLVLKNKLQNTENELATISFEKEKYVNELEATSKSNHSMVEDIAVLTHPENKKIILKEVGFSPSALASIYWNQNSQSVYIHVNSLPVPEQDKQYQLWAIVDGKPVDAGVFELNTDNAFTIQTMKSISGAQAFAVTREKKGGSINPTLSAMYLLGNV